MKKTKLLWAFILIFSVMCISVMGAGFDKSRTYENNFNDVAENAWYAKSVASVYEIALMEGVSENTFDTESEMNVAQAITIAARLHSIYNDTEIPDVAEGRWFQKYVDYCLANGIMVENQFDSYSRAVCSFEMVQLFAKALPKEFYPAINSVERVHDIPKGLIFEEDILMFYNAGILNGNDENGTFLPMSAITRKRAAVIISRVALNENRINVEIKDIPDVLTPDEFSELLHRHTKKDALDSVYLANYGDIKISASMYRYFAFIHKQDEENIEKEMKQYAALAKLTNESGITISRETYESCLVSYYVNRASTYNGGITYFDALEAQKFTDVCFVDLSNMSLFSQMVPESFCEKVTNQEVYDYVMSNDYVYAKHILISKDTEDAYRLALELRLAINDGADFDELLEKHGEDPGMKAREGGYFFTYGTMVEPFEKASFALSEGQVSNIVESDFGYHIIKRLSFTPEELYASPDFETIVSHAGSEKFYDTLNEQAGLVEFEYTENFEGLSELLK